MRLLIAQVWSRIFLLVVVGAMASACSDGCKRNIFGGCGFEIIPEEAVDLNGYGFATSEDVPLYAAFAISTITSITDDLDYRMITAPTKGTATIVDKAAGLFAYYPFADVNGDDTFYFTVVSGELASPPITVSVAITAVNDLPRPAPDFITTMEEMPVILPVTDNDMEVDGDPIIVSAVTDVIGGTALVTDNTIRFTGALDFVGIGSFVYYVTDGVEDDPDNMAVPMTGSVVVFNLNDTPVTTFEAFDRTAVEDQLFSIGVAGNFTDVDLPYGDALTYFARLADDSPLPLWLGFNELSGVFSGTPQNSDAAVSHHVEIGAVDLDGAWVTDQFYLSVENVNDAPVAISAITDQSTLEDELYSYNVTSHFIDIDFNNPAPEALTYFISVTGGTPPLTWLRITEATGEITGVPRNINAESTFFVTVGVADLEGAIATTSYSIFVSNVNDVPELVMPIPDQLTLEDAGYAYNIAGHFDDDDIIHGDSVTYNVQLAAGTPLPGWLGFDPVTGEVFGVPANADAELNYDIEVFAWDQNGTFVSDVYTLFVSNTNDVPVTVATVADDLVLEDVFYNLNIAGFFDDDDLVHGDVLSYDAYVSGSNVLPGFLWLDSASGDITGTPLNADANAAYDIVIEAIDLAGTSVTDVYTLAVSNTNDGPQVAAGITDVVVLEDTGYAQNVSYAFGDDDFVHGPPALDNWTFTATLVAPAAGPLPPWISIDAVTGEVTATPDNAVADVTYVIEVEVTDNFGASVTQQYSLFVSNTNDVPVTVATVADDLVLEDVFYNLNIAGFFDDDDLVHGDVLSYDAYVSGSNVLPGFLWLDSASGDITGTPLNADANAAYDIVIEAIDLAGTSVTDVYTLTVSNTNDGPQVAAGITDVVVLEDTGYAQNVSYAFGDDDFVHGPPALDNWTFTATLVAPAAGPLPPWISIDAVTGEVTATPDNAVADVTYVIEVEVTDNFGASVTQQYSLFVSNMNEAPFTTVTIGPQLATEDILFSLDISGFFDDEDLIHGDAITYFAQLTNAALPAWLTFSGSQFSGTPDDPDVGQVHSVVAGAVDAAGLVTTQTFTLTVSNVNDLPVAFAGALTMFETQTAYTTLAATDVETYPLSFTVFTAPTLGTLSTFDTSTGFLVFAPNPNSFGTETFYYRVSDGTAFSATAPVSVTVLPLVQYVAPVASGQQDGTSWANARGSIQGAIDFLDANFGGAFGPGKRGQIWVREGTYRGQPASPVMTMANYIDVYGGFAGTETTLAQRGQVDPSRTVLSGDVNANGQKDNGLDAIHVVVAATAVVDGVRISGGNASGTLASGRGGGIYNVGGQLQLNNIEVMDNRAVVEGGGIYSDDTGTLTLYSGLVSGNIVQAGANVFGGGIFVDAAATISSSTIMSNMVTSSSNDARGGGIYKPAGNLVVVDSTVVGNVAYGAVVQGAGVYSATDGLTLENVMLSSNTATGTNSALGGGLYNNASVLTVTGLTADSNVVRGLGTTGFGAGIYKGNSAASMQHVTASNNIAYGAATVFGGGVYAGGGTLDLADVELSGNRITTPGAFATGAGLYLGTGGAPSLNIVRGRIAHNRIQWSSNVARGAGISVGSGNHTVTDVVIEDNRIQAQGALWNVYGAGIAAENATSFQLFNASVARNQVHTLSGDGWGAGAGFNTGDGVLIGNTGFFANDVSSGNDGGGAGLYMRNLGASPSVTNVTFIDNTAFGAGSAFGGGLATLAAGVQAANLAFWGNTAEFGPDYYDSGALPNDTVLASCAAQDLTLLSPGNVVLGADPAVVAESLELFLDQGGGCIDVGLNASATTAFTAFGEDWTIQTTDLDAAFVDAAPVDAGFHKDPARFWVKDFRATETQVQWQTNNTADCVIENDQNGTISTVATFPSGNIGHGLPVDAYFTMRCRRADSYPVVVSAFVNQPPQLISAINSPQQTTEESLYSYNTATHFTDINMADTVTYYAVEFGGNSLPGWMAIDQASGEITGVPDDADVNSASGGYDIQVFAIDLDGSFADDVYNIKVTNINDIPFVQNPVTDMLVNQDATFNFDVGVAGSGGVFNDDDLNLPPAEGFFESLTYEATLVDGSPLPGWLVEVNGSFNGTPGNSDVGIYDIRIFAYDAALAVTYEDFSLEVSNINDTPFVALPVTSPQYAWQGTTYVFSAVPHFDDVDTIHGDSLTYAVAASTPAAAWLSIDPVTGGLIGTPDNFDVGSYTIALRAYDLAGTFVTTSYTLEVSNINDPPTVAVPVTSPQYAWQGTAYAFNFVPHFDDIDTIHGDALTYAVAASTPAAAWLSVDPVTGWITGTAANEDVDSYTLDIRAYDQDGLFATASYTLNVSNINDAPFVVTPVTSPQYAWEDTAYAFNVAAHFDDPDVVYGDVVTYAISTSTPVAAWLSIDPVTGWATGTATNTEVGIYTIDLRAYDLAGVFATASYTLEVSNTNDPPILNFAAFVTVQIGEDIEIDASPGVTDPDWIHGPIAYFWKIVNSPLTGALTVTAASGEYVYTPVQLGFETFDIAVSDGVVDSNTVTIKVHTTPRIRYVAPVSAGTGDGRSWANATDIVQGANDGLGGNGQIWIQQGTYRPTTDNTPVLVMDPDTAVYGGFAGAETLITDRATTDPTLTILSGDIDSNGFSANDAYHVVVAANGRLINDLTITGGNASLDGADPDDRGAGLLLTGGSLYVTNVEIHTNSAEYGGGGLHVEGGASLWMNNSWVYSNVVSATGGDSSRGGGVFVDGANLFATSITIHSNLVTSVADVAYGGGVQVEGPSIIYITNATVYNNTVTSYGNNAEGGGLWSGDGSSLVVSGITLRNNAVLSSGTNAFGGGGYINGNTAHLTMTDGQIYSNLVSSTSNFARGGGFQSGSGGFSATRSISNTTIYKNQVWSVGGSRAEGGGVYSNGNELRLENVRIFQNTSTSTTNQARGGGIMVDGSGNQLETYKDVIVSGNIASGTVSLGGGLYTHRALWITNSQFDNNQAANGTSRGGGIWFGRVGGAAKSSLVTNVTIVGNVAATIGPGVYLENDGNVLVSLANTTFWGNIGGAADIEKGAVSFVTGESLCSETDLSVYGPTNTQVVSNPVTKAASGEYFLIQTSNCVDWGNNVSATAAYAAPISWLTLTTDIDGAVTEGTALPGPVTVDTGMHFDPTDVWLKSVTSDVSDMYWTTNNGSNCDIEFSDTGTSFTLPAGALPDGNFAHGRGAGVTLTMSCNSPTYTKSATTVVP